MKKSDELKQKKAALELEIDALVSKDNRSAEESSELKNKYETLKGLTEEIDLETKNEQWRAQKAAQEGQEISPNDERDLGKYSFARAIKILVKNNGNIDAVDGIEGEMLKEGIKERQNLGLETKGFVVPSIVLSHRAATGQNVTTEGDGGYLLQDMPFQFIESLKNQLVLQKAGATFLTGLVGNLPLLKGGSFTASWIAEGSNVSFTKEAFTKVTMTPKNLMVAGAITKQLLVQTNNLAERLIRDELVKAIAHGLQTAAINGSGSNNQPTGILNYVGIGSVVGGDNGAAPDWADIVNLESAVAIDNAEFGNTAYLTNAKVRGKLKQTLKSSNVSGYVWDGQGMNGYPAHVTNAVPSNLDKGTSTGVCSAIIFGSFSELFMGMWGGLDIIVDPFTRADYNEIKLVLNQFADVALRNPESFAAMKDALTT